ncbi:unnamed protein product [Blepharisma stoltei]|uniref:Uncharacterized protein n=1 Tax=Blepharisma stoltei TaxID=1481888 RepID=A0AAU9IPJ7_9CILI|nr:unnamed protein product [Blepharisma stoltei]
MQKESNSEQQNNCASLPTFTSKPIYRARRIFPQKTPEKRFSSISDKDTIEIVEKTDYNQFARNPFRTAHLDDVLFNSNSRKQESDSFGEPAKKALNFDDKNLEHSFAQLLTPEYGNLSGKRKRTDNTEPKTCKKDKRSAGPVPIMMVELIDPETNQTENFRCFKEETMFKHIGIELEESKGDADNDVNSDEDLISESVNFLTQELEEEITKQP